MPSDTNFSEVRFTRVLSRPLLLHGNLHYGGPGRLGRDIEKPFHETTTIHDDRVEVDRQGRQPRRFSLDRAPQLRALLGSFSALLGGDAQKLARDYRIVLTQRAPGWTLTLTPRDEQLADHLRDIVVDGRDDAPRCFALHESDGDLSVMLLGELSHTKLPSKPTRAGLEKLCQHVP